MRSIRTLFCALAALGMTAVPTASAQDDPNPGEIIGQCVEVMREITQRAANGQREAAMATVQRLEILAEEGAPPARLVAAAHRGVRRIHEIAGSAHDALDAAARRCARALDAIKAPPAFHEALRQARQAAGERLRTTTEHSRNVILETLHGIVGKDGSVAA